MVQHPTDGVGTVRRLGSPAARIELGGGEALAFERHAHALDGSRHHKRTASGTAVINSVGNLAGFVSPYAIGWIIDRTHSTTLGVYTLTGCLLVGSLLALTMPKRLVNR